MNENPKIRKRISKLETNISKVENRIPKLEFTISKLESRISKRKRQNPRYQNIINSKVKAIFHACSTVIYRRSPLKNHDLSAKSTRIHDKIPVKTEGFLAN